MVSLLAPSGVTTTVRRYFSVAAPGDALAGGDWVRSPASTALDLDLDLDFWTPGSGILEAGFWRISKKKKSKLHRPV